MIEHDKPTGPVALAVTILTIVSAIPVEAQDSAPDSLAVLDAMQDLQQEFEQFRVSRIPVESERTDVVCDERIGRICIWFGGEEGERFPAEFREVQQARVELIRALTDALDEVHDPWILGQAVHYLVERPDLESVSEAERLATECGAAARWWCSALAGYSLHVRGEYVEAEDAFRRAVAEMPDDVRRSWTSLRYIVSDGAEEAFEALPPSEREETWELFWRLSDPLFIFQGNDRLTDHFARLVEVEMGKGSADPLSIQWGVFPGDPSEMEGDVDLIETLIRYGRNIGYSRTQRPTRSLQDTRRVVGHHDPKSRGYLFPEQFLESPAEIPPESWVTAPREARTWYAPRYTPDIRGLETQVGRFRRDDEMLVVGAYRPTLEGRDGGSVPAWGPAGATVGEPNATLFLVPVDGSPAFNVRGGEAEGVLTIQGPSGRYVSGLEVVDVEGRQAWRARQGVVQRPLSPGAVDVSDLMILREGAPIPGSLDDALPYIRPGVRLRRGETFPVAWEVYGLRVREPVRVTIGFSPGRPGFLERVGDFLGILEPEEPVDVSFEETGPDQVQTVFRSVELRLPDLDPGEYTLHLRLELAGRTPLVTSRPIVVEE